jgi:hypothetical protein
LKAKQNEIDSLNQTIAFYRKEVDDRDRLSSTSLLNELDEVNIYLFYSLWGFVFRVFFFFCCVSLVVNTFAVSVK